MIGNKGRALCGSEEGLSAKMANMLRTRHPQESQENKGLLST